MGGVRIVRNGEEVRGLNYRKAIALLIYLLSTGQPQPRVVLADLLWDERSQSQALTNLRGVLTVLRSTMGENLSFSRDSVSVNPSARVWMDVLQLEASLSALHDQGKVYETTAGQVAEALALYRGDFLQGFNLTDCQGFDDWQRSERERLHQLAADGYTELVRYEIDHGQFQLGMVHAARLLEIDPLMEVAHCQMMLLLAKCGQRAAALAQYQNCEQLMRVELGVAPAKETSELYNQIRSGQLVSTQQTISVSLQNILDTRLDNLPVWLTTFVGREKEIKKVGKLLTASRLVTLTGSGGVGKSRLALEACSHLRAGFMYGVWMVRLAMVSEERFILPSIAAVFSLRESPERPLLAVLLDYLRQKELLLWIDNCEHVVGECARLIEKILNYAPQVRILATSREALGISGETDFYVPSLALPEPDQEQDTEALMSCEAARLFLDRATQALPGFRVTPETAPAIVRICRQLDGIPLALELAAARVKHLKVEQIATRLENDFSLLRSGIRTELPRHQTLRLTIDWSYNLLSGPEKILFRRLAVFPGAWGLEAAEAICSDADDSLQVDTCIQPGDILDLISGLVNKSMVIVERESGLDMHYRLLRTIRQYAWEKLEVSGESAALSERHLTYYLSWAERAETSLKGADQANCFQQIEFNLVNLHQAFIFGQEADPPRALRLASALFRFWDGTNHCLEGMHWLRTSLELPENTRRTVWRGRALCVLADLNRGANEYQIEIEWCNEALDICQEQGDLFGQAYAHFLLAHITSAVFSDLAGAKYHLDVCLEQFRAVGELWWVARSLMVYDVIFLKMGDIPAARNCADQSLRISTILKDEEGIAVCLARLAFTIGEYQGELQKGHELYDKAMAILQRLRLDYSVEYFRGMEACLVMWQGDLPAARDLNVQGLDYYRGIGDNQGYLNVLEFSGRILAFKGDSKKAIEILEEDFRSIAQSYPEQTEFEKNWVYPLIAYAYTNLGQHEFAHDLLKQVDPTKTTSIFPVIMYHRACGLLAFLENNVQQARQAYRDCLQVAVKNNYKMGALIAVEGCSGALMLLARSPEALQCLAAAQAFRHQAGAKIWPADLPFHERVKSGLAAALGEDGYQANWKIGWEMSLEQVAELALISLG